MHCNAGLASCPESTARSSVPMTPSTVLHGVPDCGPIGEAAITRCSKSLAAGLVGPGRHAEIEAFARATVTSPIHRLVRPVIL